MHVAQGGKLLRFRKWRERTPPKRRQTPIDAVSCTGRLETLPGYPLLQYILYLVTHCYSTYFTLLPTIRVHTLPCYPLLHTYFTLLPTITVHTLPCYPLLQYILYLVTHYYSTYFTLLPTITVHTLPCYPLLEYILYLVTHCYSTNSSRYFSWLYILILYHLSLYFDVVCCCELRFPTRKNLSKNYPRIFSGPSKRFASPGIHRNSLKNIGLKGCQIISLPGAPNY
jgi:hypothetical protein